jgi:hypothetical protein
LLVGETLALGSGNQQSGPLAVRGLSVLIPERKLITVAVQVSTAYSRVGLPVAQSRMAKTD